MKYRRLFSVLAAWLAIGLAPGAAAIEGGAEPAAAAPEKGGSDSGYAVLEETVPHERLFALAFDGDRGIAVGDLGMVMWTRDGGTTWTREKAPTDLALLGVTMVGDRVIAVGQRGLILVRDADGTWREIESHTEERLLNVDANADGLAYAVGAFGTVLRSADGGETWRSAAPDWSALDETAESETDISGAAGEPTMNAVQVMADGTVLLGGEIAYVLRSGDRGANWSLAYRSQVPPGEIKPAVNGLRVRPDGVGFAVGQAGLLLKTTDGGRSWRRLTTPASGNLHAVVSASDGAVVVVGMRVALRSHDEGATWEVLEGLDLALNWYSDVAAASGTGQPVAVGHSARIIRIPK